MNNFSDYRLYLSGVNYESIVDANGVSVVFFFSGCKHNCIGCHSPDTHNFENGTIVDEELIQKINDEIDKRPFINAIVLSGGDPMFSAKSVLKFLSKLNCVDKKEIWCYTGYTLEQIIENKDKYQLELLDKISILIDGKFELINRDITVPFRGSTNQKMYKLR